jgi:hypothetical protein
VDIKIILNVKVLISIRYDININGAAFCAVINSAQFSHLNPSITLGNHQWTGAAPLFSRRWVQMIIGVYGLFSNVNKSSVNIFITNNRNILLLFVRRKSWYSVVSLGCCSLFPSRVGLRTYQYPGYRQRSGNSNGGHTSTSCLPDKKEG